jgi:NhaA family Na+:H+ antiporter
MTDTPAFVPPAAWPPLIRAARLASKPVERFLSIEAASGILLLVAAVVALLWANSPWAQSSLHFWHTPWGCGSAASASSAAWNGSSTTG